MARLPKPEQLTLSNGIPVILQHLDGPAAATYWWVRTGSGDERPEEAGFAHFLEHMLFKDAAAKDSGKPSTGQMARAIESLGGDINAYTSFDQTVYHVTCASQHWTRVIDAFGEMAKPQKFLKSDFEREREVILEELAKNEDSPGRQLFQALFTETFKKHPYGKPVIGYVKTLKAATVQKLEAFYKRQYASGNMGLVLVGPVEGKQAEILKVLEKRFGKGVIPKRPEPGNKRVVEPELRGGRPAVVKRAFDVKTPTLAVSFRVPDLKHEDIAALDLAAGVLGMGELSRLYQKLFYGSSLVTDVSGSMYVPSDPGMLYFQAEMDGTARIEPAMEALLRELVRFRDEGPTDAELERVRVNSESERLYAMQTADGMAGRLGFLKYVLGDLSYDQAYLEEIRDVDAARVREVLAKYLDVRRMSAAVLLPKGEGAYDVKPLVDLAVRILGEGAGVSKKKAPAVLSRKAGGPEFITRPSGLRVIYHERPHSHVTSIHSAALGGLRLELGAPVESREADWGASYMMSLTWTKGTRARDAQAIAAMVEGSAASLDGFAGRNTVGLQMTGLARDWDKLSDLYSEVLVEPTFNASEVAHSRRVAEDSVRSIEDHTSQLCSKLFLETLFEGHPYGRLTTGSLESLARIDTSKLQSFHRRWIRPERLVLSVVGNVRRPKLERWLDALDERLRATAGTRGGGLSGDGITAEPALKAPRWVEKPLGREQLHILIGGLGARVDSGDRHAIRLLQTLLGGQSGRLFIELREKKSLAYTVAPVSFEGIEPGYVGTYIACSPGKKDEALAGIRTVLETLASKGPTAAEMKRAQEFFLGRRAMDLQADSSLAAYYGLEAVYGLPYLDQEAMTKKIASLKARDLQDTCRRYLVEPAMVTSVVG